MFGRLRSITIYETPGRFYLVGCDSIGSRYSVLKIDRIDSKVLLTGEPETTYSKEEILELLATISEGNSVVIRSSTPINSKKTKNGSLIERVSGALGILGVVRFTEGYYLIVITKASVVATIGYHCIHKISEVAMITLAMNGVSTSNEEQKYVKIFQSVDLSTDFYFSYTYDLSRSLQENTLAIDPNSEERTISADSRFVWNAFLLQPLRNNAVSERWMVEVVHGYVRQELFELPCSRLSLTLIGRRSAEYAGTRYLKRGGNLKGSVANFVETEQILWDTLSSPNLIKGRFSSFVQIRGSVPLRWSQDPATRGVVGKPLILIDINEPHAQTAGAHFRGLRFKYGNPIVVMNLVKKREKRRHEGVLHEQFVKAIRYLNQFVPPDEEIAYLSIDVARCHKQSNVLTRMDDIAMNAIKKHGWFQTFPMPYSHSISPRSSLSGLVLTKSSDGRFHVQRGVSRTNCVDCLDRTNVAQFIIGRAALACQLCAMGVLDEASISLQSELCRVYEEMFDAHGDTVAWQYAGSQLVHSIKHYKKTAALQERSRDVIQTLSRYYSNTWGDYDKQAAINLFLGIFRPQISSTKQLWELANDYYLHFPTNMRNMTDYCAWMHDPEKVEDFVIIDGNEIVEARETIQEYEDPDGTIKPRSNSRHLATVLRISCDHNYRDFYRVFEMTQLDNLIRSLMTIDSRAIYINGINQDIPQSQFMKLWKTDSKDVKKDSKKDKNARESEEEDDDNEEESQEEDVLETEPAWDRLIESVDDVKPARLVSDRDSQIPIIAGQGHDDSQSLSSRHEKGGLLTTGLQFAKDIYGLSKLGPNKEERLFYEQYVASGGMKVNQEDWEKHKPTLLTNLKRRANSERRATFFTADDTFQTEIPEVSQRSMKFYTKMCNVLEHSINKKDLSTFSKYPIIS
ncbi:hypothetical protein WR25_15419 [Diploscapter pachys]|uniref:SAC domain-containing protein n=1 Tax=Diploscapter pachys TaxID=2018661 RepID=A0A2A2LN60_9BILA|nr:hypothetical protein WR25_15419 [Diploscapter pachys]